MKFKDVLSKSYPDYNSRWVSFTIEEYAVHILFESIDNILLAEAERWVSLGGNISARLDAARYKNGQEHIHVKVKDKTIFALNRDGSAHDGYHKFQIPNKVARAIALNFPLFKLPPDNFIEHAPIEIWNKYHLQLLT